VFDMHSCSICTIGTVQARMDNDGEKLMYEVVFSGGAVFAFEAAQIRVLDEAEDATGRWMNRRVELTFQADSDEEQYTGMYTHTDPHEAEASVLSEVT
jgi:hypothetical protein